MFPIAANSSKEKADAYGVSGGPVLSATRGWCHRYNHVDEAALPALVMLRYIYAVLHAAQRTCLSRAARIVYLQFFDVIAASLR